MIWNDFMAELFQIHSLLSSKFGVTHLRGEVGRPWKGGGMEERNLLLYFSSLVEANDPEREAVVFRDFVRTRLRCLDLDRAQLVDPGGGWVVKEVVEVLLHHQPAETREDLLLARRRMDLLPSAIRDYAEEVGASAALYPPHPSVLRKMREEVLRRVEEGERLIAHPLVEAYREGVSAPVREHLLPVLDGIAPRKGGGLSSLAEGGALYLAAMERHVSLPGLAPERVHRFGLSEVARLRCAIVARGSVPNVFLAEEEKILGAYRDATSRLHHLFLHSPLFAGVSLSRPCDVKGTTEGSHYEDGVFYVDLTYPHASSQVLSLAAHETVPGHHLQEDVELRHRDSLYRSLLDHTAFVEGWAMYAESLLAPGNLESELFRAARLVVDTGLHALGWTEDEAVSYLHRTCSTITEAEARREVERYIAHPAQALAYHLGLTVFRHLARRHDRSLSDFHTSVLTGGSLPLHTLLERYSSVPRRR